MNRMLRNAAPSGLIMPMLIRSGVGLWVSVLAGVARTFCLYMALIWLAPRLGIDL